MAAAPPRERELFLAAVDQPTATRILFVEEACGSDVAMRQRVLDLLGAHDAAGEYLAQPEVATVRDEIIGTLVGPYRLVERIGEGGFGIVYVAEQSAPIRRRVAVKVLRPGVGSAEVLARFEAERHALALMDHPNIARVIDGGTAADGRPAFVMELVRGVPITAYCDEHRLTPRERLELMIDVCGAVQHAHQKGIIHRDIKPSNILVSRDDDDRTVAKVIDFGIAKATAGARLEGGFHTELRQLLGTPSYMSPEQVGLDGEDVDTRSDIYSLGALLYELLTGAPPLDRTRLSRAGMAEIQRLIREEEPPRPSARLSTLGGGAATFAASRRLDTRRLHREVSGDLDWIVMKAIEKDRTRRYDSAAALAADLRRHLRDEPVEAGPPRALHRTAKFVRRHRVGVVAATIAGLAILGGTGLALAGLIRASIDRDAAIEARNDERRARAESDLRRDEAERMSERARVRSDLIAWGLGLGEDSGVPDARRSSLTVREMLDVGAATIDRAYPDAPRRRALARQQLGALYHTLFLNQDARREIEQALALWREHPEGRDDAAMVAAIRDLVDIRRDLAAPHAELEPLRRERALLNVAILEQRLGMDGGETVAVVRRSVAAFLDGSPLRPSDLAALEADMLGALDRSDLACESEELLAVVDALAIAMASASNRWADNAVAAPLVHVIDWTLRRCPDLPRRNKTMAMLLVVAADVAASRGRLDDALRLSRLASAALARHLPPGHWLLAEERSLEGHALVALGRTTEAAPLLVDGCAGLIAGAGGSPEHVRGGVIRLLGLVRATGRGGYLGRFDTSLRPVAEPIERFVIELDGDPAEAASALARAVRAAPHGADDPRPEALASLLGMLQPYADSVDGAAARPCRELLEALTEFPTHPSPTVRGAKATALWWAGVLALTDDDLDAAEGHFRTALAIRIADLGPDELWCHNCRRMLGRVLMARGRCEEGAEVVVQAYRDMRRTGTPAAIAVVAAARDAALGLGCAGRQSEAGALLATQVAAMLEAEDAMDAEDAKDAKDAKEGASAVIPPDYHLLVARPLALIADLPPESYELAERGARRAVEGLPDSGLAPLTLAVALHRQRRHAEAIEFLDQADAIDRRGDRPANPVAALVRAACEAALGRAEEAAVSRDEADRRAASYSFDRYTTRSWDSLRAELAPVGR